MTEWLHFHFSLSCIGEGNGNPLQCSCLENPRDGGAWWAAVYGVAQSRTRLKRLSSSSTYIYEYNIHIHIYSICSMLEDISIFTLFHFLKRIYCILKCIYLLVYCLLSSTRIYASYDQEPCLLFSPLCPQSLQQYLVHSKDSRDIYWMNDTNNFVEIKFFMLLYSLM